MPILEAPPRNAPKDAPEQTIELAHARGQTATYQRNCNTPSVIHLPVLNESFFPARQLEAPPRGAEKATLANSLFMAAKETLSCSAGVLLGTLQFCQQIAEAPVRLTVGVVGALFANKDTLPCAAFSGFLLGIGSSLANNAGNLEAQTFGQIAILFGLGVTGIGITTVCNRESAQKFVRALDYSRPLHHVLLGKDSRPDENP